MPSDGFACEGPFTLRHEHQRFILIEVADDGVGFPENFNPAVDGELGFQLMRALASGMGAELEFEHDSLGVCARLVKPLGSSFFTSEAHMSSEAKPHPLSVFLVEDEGLLQMLVADMIEELGHTVIAQASDLHQALNLAQTADFDVAILDINLKGQRIDPVADASEHTATCPLSLPADMAKEVAQIVFATGQRYRSHLLYLSLRKPLKQRCDRPASPLCPDSVSRGRCQVRVLAVSKRP